MIKYRQIEKQQTKPDRPQEGENNMEKWYRYRFTDGWTIGACRLNRDEIKKLEAIHGELEKKERD